MARAACWCGSIAARSYEHFTAAGTGGYKDGICRFQDGRVRYTVYIAEYREGVFRKLETLTTRAARYVFD